MKKKIPVASASLIGNEKKYVMDCLKSTYISSVGEYVEKFEKKFACFCKSKYAISCSNGTVALHLALLAFDVKPEDEIIVPALTYISTVNAITYCGAKPVFVDSEPDTWNIDAELIEQKITSRTKGIIVVHLYGHPVDMDKILKIAKRHSLFVIEDAAEAHGSKYKNRIVGSIGDIGTFSFFGNKIITTGEGGMIVANSAELANKIRILKGQGMDPNRRYWFSVIGYNYRMTNIQAAIGLAQLEKINYHLRKRRQVANWYYKYLRDFSEYISLPVEKKLVRHVYWMFNISLKKNVTLERDSLIELLYKKGIETRPIFYPAHIMPPYKEKDLYLPVAEKISKRSLSLPTHANLSENDIKFICKTLKGTILNKSQ